VTSGGQATRCLIFARAVPLHYDVWISCMKKGGDIPFSRAVTCDLSQRMENIQTLASEYIDVYRCM
jgi:hypothetical protein